MKKLLSLALIIVFAFSALPVSAAEFDATPTPNSYEIRYQANQLHYEFSNPNTGQILQSGNLGNLISSTPYKILDYNTTGDKISMPFGIKLTIYPEGQPGFFMVKGTQYFIQAGFKDANQGLLFTEIDENGKGNIHQESSKLINGQFGEIRTTTYPDGYYRFVIENINSNSTYLTDFNFFIMYP